MHDHKFDPVKAERLLAPERYQKIKPDILLQKLGVPPGSTILDLGCGNGFFTFPASAAMGENGMVIAADSSGEMLQLLSDRNPRDNVQVLQVDEVAMDVDSDSVDGAVLLNLYHELDDRTASLKELKRVLKPNGHLLILDWSPEIEYTSGPPLEHRIPIKMAVEELTSAGFKVDKKERYTEETWLIVAHLV